MKAKEVEEENIEPQERALVIHDKRTQNTGLRRMANIWRPELKSIGGYPSVTGRKSPLSLTALKRVANVQQASRPSEEESSSKLNTLEPKEITHAPALVDESPSVTTPSQCTNELRQTETIEERDITPTAKPRPVYQTPKGAVTASALSDLVERYIASMPCGKCNEVGIMRKCGHNTCREKQVQCGGCKGYASGRSLAMQIAAMTEGER